jgi:hypothetical protein
MRPFPLSLRGRFFLVCTFSAACGHEVVLGNGTPLDGSGTCTGPTCATEADSGKVFTGPVNKVDLLFDIDNSASMGDKQAYIEQAVPDLVTRLITPNCVKSTPSTTPGGPPTITIVSQSAVGGACLMGGTLEFVPVHDMHIGIISSSLGPRGVDTTEDAVAGAVCVPNASTGTPAPGGSPFLDGMPQLPTHNDDRGHLLSRITPTFAPPVTAAEAQQTAEQEAATFADVGAENFLDWFPEPQPFSYTTTATGGIDPLGTKGPVLTPPAAALSYPLGAIGMEPGTLEGDFAALVAGTHAYGCGIESQLETWYRFLIQPDPYGSIDASTGHALWAGIDQTILQQRHDFLRPDSLVAIIVLSDENDSEIDVRSFGGEGYLFMDQTYKPLRGTSPCATDPGSSACTSCGNASAAGDPNCGGGNNAYTAENDPSFFINLRHVHMQQRFGITVQFPLQRYVLGLTSPTVPDRDHEYPAGAASYQGGTVLDANGNVADPQDLNCANPLFAGSLPTGLGDPSDFAFATAVCNAAQAGSAPRSPNLVFYAHIGGVPHQLLQLKPGETDPVTGTTCALMTPEGTPTSPADCPQKDTLTVTDWTSILGAGLGATSGAGAFDYTGIDPHMIEAFDPNSPTEGRTSSTGATIPVVPAAGVPAPGTAPAPDPISGWDWETSTLFGTVPAHALPVDVEYACIFPLMNSEGVPTPRDCSGGLSDPLNSYECDCESLGLPPEAVPSVCGLKNPNAPYAAAGTPAGPIQVQPSTPPTVVGNDYTTQYFAKTYPTIRELTLANLMGTQGIISSLCPIHTVPSSTTMPDQLYGYRPAINAIVNRLRTPLAVK